MPIGRLDRHALRRGFEIAAPDYDRAAALQAEVGRRMVERLALIRLVPRRIADLGAATGGGAIALSRRYRKARVVAVDWSPTMLARLRRKRPWRARIDLLAGDVTRLPLTDGAVDMVFSNLLLPWLDDPDRFFRECLRVLRPGGLLLFSSLGPDTLGELRGAWRTVDSHVHVNTFIDMHDLGDALVRARFADPVMDVETLTLTYPDLKALLDDLRAGGSRNANFGRASGLTGRGAWRAVARAYERERRGDGRLPATFEVVHGHAWAPQGAVSWETGGGEIAVPVSRIGRR